MRRNQGRKLGPIGSIVFGGIFLAIGLFVGLVFGKPILDKANASEDWPSVPGVVTHSEVTTHRSDGKTMYKADVRYRFEVDGQNFEANTVWFGGDMSSSSSSGAYETTSEYPVDREVAVYYNPEEPFEAVLEPGAHLSSYMVFGIGMLFAVVGGLIGIGGVFGLLRRVLRLGAMVARS